MTSERPTYTVVSPVRDEAGFVGHTIECVLSQTILPAEWVVVDDGSSDDTLEIVQSYAESHPWIRIVSRPRSGPDDRFGAVTRAFIAGFRSLEDASSDFVLKIDGDISFEPDYIERLLTRSAQRDGVGIASGVYKEWDGRSWHTTPYRWGIGAGALRAHRRPCLADIVDRMEACDDLDLDLGTQLHAEALGWDLATFDDLVFVHCRPEGGKDNVLKGRYEQGAVCNRMGYYPWYAVARGVLRVAEPPYVVGAAAFLAGFFAAYADPRSRRADEGTRALVRARQLRRVLELPIVRAFSSADRAPGGPS
jgi:biofilm PGA synthesis N-glycosyltransferase PgaC